MKVSVVPATFAMDAMLSSTCGADGFQMAAEDVPKILTKWPHKIETHWTSTRMITIAYPTKLGPQLRGPWWPFGHRGNHPDGPEHCGLRRPAGFSLQLESEGDHWRMSARRLGGRMGESRVPGKVLWMWGAFPEETFWVNEAFGANGQTRRWL